MGFMEEATAPDPQLPGKPNQTKKKNKNRRRRWKASRVMSCFQGSCLGDSTPGEEQTIVAAAGGGHADAHVDDDGPRPKQRTLRFWMRQAKQTVPVQLDSGRTEVAKDEGRKLEEERKREEEEEEEVKLPVHPVAVAEAKRSLFRRFLPKRFHETKACGTASDPGPVEVEISGANSETDMIRISTSRRRSGPPRASDPTATSCRTLPADCRKSSKGLTKSAETTSHSNVAGLAILLLLILAFLSGGRLFAILCTCAFFYLIPLFRPPTKKKSVPNPMPRERKKKAVEIHYDSEEYKKRVVLEGLLERNRKRSLEFR